MTGTLAQTIQGEAGSNPANQFAVASTIYNRMQAGTFPGGTDPTAIVNAPQQFVGFAATPNSSAQAMADAIQNGTLSSYGSTGNAVNFQSGQTAVNNGFTNGGANIGGNYFSDRFGAPTSNFQAPAYGGVGSTIATGPADNSQGSTPASGNPSPLGTSVTQNPSGTSSTTSSAAQGTPIQTALQPEEQSFITTAITGIENAFGGGLTKAITAAETAMGNYLGGLQNWFIRAAVILLGVILIGIALVVLMWDHGGSQVAQTATRVVAA
jgi:hypothetical protein